MATAKKSAEKKPTAKKPVAIDCKRVELDGIRYVILRESVFEGLCEKAGVARDGSGGSQESLEPGFELDRASLAEKLVRRRRAAGLSQAELARRAGIRPETLNRIERGRSTPDFATVRKLVVAMDAAESKQIADQLSSQHPPPTTPRLKKESKDANSKQSAK